ncbi:MAG: hypothetical protein IKS33_00775 [Bacteroidales bacterium]|jgi:hypothetical protein|nr:hypothetical protein [Bacteroidales bacterium]MBR4452772.1 hypothetical protein [Bacteroidales bacterium]MCR5554753.1 hypothetical protein [Bacteroidales bacterium]
MKIWLVLLISIIPTIVIALLAYFMLKSHTEKELKEQVLTLKREGRKTINPIRLQAYERLALFLERIRPESLLLRVAYTNFTALQYRTLLLANIRSEFEHNLSQQVYLSSALWQATKKAKEETVKVINLAAGQVSPEAPASELASKILELYVSYQPEPVDIALEILHQEITELY